MHASKIRWSVKKLYIVVIYIYEKIVWRQFFDYGHFFPRPLPWHKSCYDQCPSGWLLPKWPDKTRKNIYGCEKNWLWCPSGHWLMELPWTKMSMGTAPETDFRMAWEWTLGETKNIFWMDLGRIVIVGWEGDRAATPFSRFSLSPAHFSCLRDDVRLLNS